MGFLDNAEPPNILIYGERLGLEALKTPNFKAVDLLKYWRVLAQAPEGHLEAMEIYFDRAPTILHGEQHFAARRFLRLLIEELKKICIIG